jgi:hypothetical protein
MGNRPVARDLRPLPLADAMKALTGGGPGGLVITMGEGQWDGILSAAYENGWILLELNDAEVPVRAYQKGT